METRKLSLEQMEGIEGGGSGWNCLGYSAQMVITMGAMAGSGAVTGGWAALAFMSSFTSAAVGIGINCGTWLGGLHE